MAEHYNTPSRLWNAVVKGFQNDESSERPELASWVPELKLTTQPTDNVSFCCCFLFSSDFVLGFLCVLWFASYFMGNHS